MRTRLIRPEFFEDELMATLSIETRLVYIGLWTVCDDAGYFEQSVRRIAGTLFRYDDVTAREDRVAAALAALVDAKRVVLLECGIHGTVPTLPRHKTSGGTQAKTVEKRHLTDCSPRPVRTRPSKSPSESVSDSESVSGPTTSLADAMVESGGFAAQLATSRRSA